HQRLRLRLAFGHPFAMLGPESVVLSIEFREFGPADHLDVLVTIFINSASTNSCRSRQCSRSISLLVLARMLPKAVLHAASAFNAASLAQRRCRSCSRACATMPRARSMTRVL